MVLSFAILARLITPKEMGILAVLSMVNGLCQMIASLALPQAVIRFIAESRGRGENQVAASVFYQAIRATLLLAAPFGSAIFLGAAALSAQLLGGQNYTMFFQLLAFDALLYAGALPVLTAAMLGLQKFKETAAIGIANSLVRQSLIIILIILLQNFVGLVIAWVISDLLAASVYTWYVSKTLGRPRFEFPLRRLLGFSWPLLMSNAVAFASTWFDRALLLIFLPLAILGVYNATMTAFGVLASIPSAVATVLFPAYSAMQSPDHSRQTSTDAIRKASRYSSLVVVPLALGLVATAKSALTLFVGPAYVGGVEPLMTLSATLAFTLVGTVLSPMLLALGETSKSSAIAIVTVILGLVAALVLLPLWGVNGAAVARAFAMILSAVLTFLVLNKKLRLQLDLEAMWKSLVAGTVMAIVVFAVQISLYSRFLLPLYALVGALTYLASLRILHAIKPSDAELIRQYLGPRFKFILDPLERYLVTEKESDTERRSGVRLG